MKEEDEVIDIPVTADSVSLNSSMESHETGTSRKYDILYSVIKDFSVKDKRRVFADMRTANIKVTADTLFPEFGFVAGEFSVFAVLTENSRKKK
jgi:hypothetical protein